MKVLVTGAAGLLGQNVVRHLLARGDDVVAVDALTRFALFGESTPQPVPEVLLGDRCAFYRTDFMDLDILDMIRTGSFDAVVHSAAQTSHPRSIETPWRDFEINAAGTLRLLETVRDVLDLGKKAPRFVNIGSCKVYDMSLATTVQAESRIELDPTWGALVDEQWPVGGFITPFGVSKLAADLYVSNYSLLYGLDACTIRPGCFTGSGSLAVEQQNWAPMLVREMVRGADFKVFGFGGKQVRDLLHVDDLARLVLACLDHPERWHGTVFNACGGPGRDVSILEAVQIVERIAGTRGELCFERERPADWAWFVGSSHRACTALGWVPQISLESIFGELCEEAAK